MNNIQIQHCRELYVPMQNVNRMMADLPKWILLEIFSFLKDKPKSARAINCTNKQLNSLGAAVQLGYTDRQMRNVFKKAVESDDKKMIEICLNDNRCELDLSVNETINWFKNYPKVLGQILQKNNAQKITICSHRLVETSLDIYLNILDFAWKGINNTLESDHSAILTKEKAEGIFNYFLAKIEIIKGVKKQLITNPLENRLRSLFTDENSPITFSKLNELFLYLKKKVYSNHCKSLILFLNFDLKNGVRKSVACRSFERFLPQNKFFYKNLSLLDQKTLKELTLMALNLESNKFTILKPELTSESVDDIVKYVINTNIGNANFVFNKFLKLKCVY